VVCSRAETTDEAVPETPAAPAPTLSGSKVILWLFGTTVGLALFAWTADGSQYRPLVWRALAGDLAIPVVAWFVIRGIHETEHRRRWAWWAASLVAAAVTYGVVVTLIGWLTRVLS